MTALLRPSPEARVLAALRAMLARNQQEQAAVERIAARPEVADLDRTLEALIVAAWKGEDVGELREAVRRLFHARIGADAELVEGLDLTRRVAAIQIGEVRRG